MTTRIKQYNNTTNQEVPERIEQKRELLNIILHRNANMIGHILRRNCLYDVTEGQMIEVKGV